MPSRLRFRLESGGNNGEPKMGFFGCVANHCFVMGVKMGVVMDLKFRWFEGFADFGTDCIFDGRLEFGHYRICSSQRL